MLLGVGSLELAGRTHLGELLGHVALSAGVVVFVYHIFHGFQRFLNGGVPLVKELRPRRALFGISGCGIGPRTHTAFFLVVQYSRYRSLDDPLRSIGCARRCLILIEAVFYFNSFRRLESLLTRVHHLRLQRLLIVVGLSLMLKGHFLGNEFGALEGA